MEAVKKETMLITRLYILFSSVVYFCLLSKFYMSKEY
jgi:hypothetical protein